MLLRFKSVRSHWPIAVILIFAAGIRLWGVDFGLPYAYHVDEPRYIHSAVGIIQSGNLNPGWFNQPSLYTYLVTILIGGYYLFGRLIGNFQTVDDLFRPPYHFDGFIDLPNEFLIARLLTIIFGIATIWLVYYTARRWMGNIGAIVAALFLAVSIFHVSSSRFIATDVPVAFFAVLTLYAAGQIAEGGGLRDYLLAGIALGLAIGTKYSAYVLVLPIILAHLLAWRRGTTKLLSTSLLWLTLSTGFTAFITTPFALFDSSSFIEDVIYEWRHHKILGHIGAEGDSAQWLSLELISRSDRWLTITAIFGFGLGLFRKNWKILLVFSFTIAYFISMATNSVRFERFLVPLIPALALAAGYFIGELYEQYSGKNRQLIITAVVVLILIEPAISVMRSGQILSNPDTRTIARNWIKENIPTGSRIAREAFAPNLDGMGYDVNTFSRLNEHPVLWYVENGFDYLVFAQARYGNLYDEPDRYAEQIAGYNALFESLTLVSELRGSYVDRPDHVIRIYSSPP